MGSRSNYCQIAWKRNGKNGKLSEKSGLLAVLKFITQVTIQNESFKGPTDDLLTWSCAPLNETFFPWNVSRFERNCQRIATCIIHLIHPQGTAASWKLKN